MIERIDNGIQLLVLGICLAYALFRASRYDKREWAILGMFYGAVFAGNLYWILYLVFFGNTPFFSFIPDISWCAGYLFLLLLLLQIRGKKAKSNYLFLILAAVFTVGMCLFFILYNGNDSVTNVIYAVIMALLLWQAAAGFAAFKSQAKEKTGMKYLYMAVILFVVVEYALWTASCFWKGVSFLEPYYWFDVLLTLCYFLFIPALKKGVDR